MTDREADAAEGDESRDDEQRGCRAATRLWRATLRLRRRDLCDRGGSRDFDIERRIHFDCRRPHGRTGRAVAGGSIGDGHRSFS